MKIDGNSRKVTVSEKLRKQTWIKCELSRATAIHILARLRSVTFVTLVTWRRRVKWLAARETCSRLACFKSLISQLLQTCHRPLNPGAQGQAPPKPTSARYTEQIEEGHQNVQQSLPENSAREGRESGESSRSALSSRGQLVLVSLCDFVKASDMHACTK